MNTVAFLAIAVGLTAAQTATAQRPANVQMIYMGGSDCPPCVRWRASELPKLQQSEIFRSITFTYVQKPIAGTVPPALFLPAEARPYKDQMDAASGGMGGSPQVAVIVDGHLYDYYFGVRNAEAVEQMIQAIRTDRKYPFDRCVRRDRSRACLVKG